MASYTANNPKRRTLWIGSAFALLLGYAGILLFAMLNTSESIQKNLFIKVVAWEPLIKQFHKVAQQVETETLKTPVFVPLDNFPIASELAFYQNKFLNQGKISKAYPIEGSHVLGGESLMYRYWSNNMKLQGRPLILIAKEIWHFEADELRAQIIAHSKVQKIYSKGQGQGLKNIPYYYQVVQLKK